MNKKILVIGAGLAQVDAIEHAKQLGYYVCASDGSSDAEGLNSADESRIIDVKDKDKNLAWAKKLKIHAVISFASDIALPTVFHIRKALGLPGLEKEPMEISLDKSLQRELFQKHSLPQPDFQIVKEIGKLKEAAFEIGFPVVVKPVDNAGSRGVETVHTEKELSAAFETALDFSPQKKLIVEKYVEGLELTIEGFSFNGKHHILAISDKLKPNSKYKVATQLAYPANISEKDYKQVIELMTKALSAAGVDNTPTHSEIILTDNGPQIVEIACRGGGFYVFTRVVQAASGYDIVGNWTRLCAGDNAKPVMINPKGVVLRFLTAPAGRRLVSISGFDKVKKMEGVQVGMFVKTGSIIPVLKTDGSRTGWIITFGRDRQDALKKADAVMGSITFETEAP